MTTLLCTKSLRSVLRTAKGALGHFDFLHGLQTTGRTEDLRQGAPSPIYLLKGGLVANPDRGRCSAA
jgi:hypothetical protein